MSNVHVTIRLRNNLNFSHLMWYVSVTVWFVRNLSEMVLQETCHLFRLFQDFFRKFNM